MQIDDDGESSLGSYNKYVKVSFGNVSSTVTSAKEDKEMHHSKKPLKDVAKNFESVVKAELMKEWSY